MPPRFTYWTILLGGSPTSFRAKRPDELATTLKQLQRRHPDATLKWFARGKLWASPEEAAAARRAETPERRPKDWRPGGDHRDPRAVFQRPDRRARWKKRFWDERRRQGTEPGAPPQDHARRDHRRDREFEADRRPAGGARPDSSRPPRDGGLRRDERRGDPRRPRFDQQKGARRFESRDRPSFERRTKPPFSGQPPHGRPGPQRPAGGGNDQTGDRRYGDRGASGKESHRRSRPDRAPGNGLRRDRPRPPRKPRR
jgi:hypothetical protein